MESTATTPPPPPPIFRLSEDTLHQIFSSLTLVQITICKSVCKFFNQTLTSPSFIHLFVSTRSPLNLLALRTPHAHHHHHHHHHHRNSSISNTGGNDYLYAFDPDSDKWIRFDLTFLPFRLPSPVASSNGLVYLWGESVELSSTVKSLVVSNPLNLQYRVLPQLGSAWSRHGSVLVGPPGRVLVLTELATLYFSSGFDQWLKFSSNLPSKPRSPVLVADSVYTLCDVGSPWRSQWKLYSFNLAKIKSAQPWFRLERHEWGDVFDILKRPRLVRGTGNQILMVGGLKSSFSLNSTCSTILILRLDLESLEWEEAGRMPIEMFECFKESSKFKVFGSSNRICFSAKRIGRLALWDWASGEAGKGVWRWIDGGPGNVEGVCRGFVFEASLNALP